MDQGFQLSQLLASHEDCGEKCIECEDVKGEQRGWCKTLQAKVTKVSQELVGSKCVEKKCGMGGMCLFFDHYLDHQHVLVKENVVVKAVLLSDSIVGEPEPLLTELLEKKHNYRLKIWKHANDREVGPTVVNHKHDFVSLGSGMGGVFVSYIMMQKLEPMTRAELEEVRVQTDLASLVCKIAEAGLFHTDMQLNNIMYSDTQLMMVDWEAGYMYAQLRPCIPKVDIRICPQHSALKHAGEVHNLPAHENKRPTDPTDKWITDAAHVMMRVLLVKIRFPRTAFERHRKEPTLSIAEYMDVTTPLGGIHHYADEEEINVWKDVATNYSSSYARGINDLLAAEGKNKKITGKVL
tara:strand:+ start:1082 stop:2134 length:1053 start_codon:yes stop_codon:yes gene_type:complete